MLKITYLLVKKHETKILTFSSYADQTDLSKSNTTYFHLKSRCFVILVRNTLNTTSIPEFISYVPNFSYTSRNLQRKKSRQQSNQFKQDFHFSRILEAFFQFRQSPTKRNLFCALFGCSQKKKLTCRCASTLFLENSFCPLYPNRDFKRQFSTFFVIQRYLFRI